MNQKNIFTGIAVVLLLQGIVFFVVGEKIVLDAFPNLDELGKFAGTSLMEVISMLSILVGLIAYACRNSPSVVWAFLVGTGLLSILTLKHVFMDRINVPIPAIIIQLAIVLLCAYLWMQGRKAN